MQSSEQYAQDTYGMAFPNRGRLNGKEEIGARVPTSQRHFWFEITPGTVSKSKSTKHFSDKNFGKTLKEIKSDDFKFST